MGTMKSESGQAQPVRRHHERAFKAKLIELSLQPAASVPAFALEHGINANMLFTWRRTWLRQGMATAESEPVLLPVLIERQESSVAAPSGEATALAPPSPSRIPASDCAPLESHDSVGRGTRWRP